MCLIVPDLALNIDVLIAGSRRLTRTRKKIGDESGAAWLSVSNSVVTVKQENPRRRPEEQYAWRLSCEFPVDHEIC